LKLEYERQQGLNQIKEDALKIDEDRNKKSLENITTFNNKRIEIATFDAEKQKEIVAERNKQIFNSEIAIANARLQAATDISNGLIALGNAFIKDQKS
jgi:hypothetical protein